MGRKKLPAATPSKGVGPAEMEFLDKIFRSLNTLPGNGRQDGMPSRSIAVLDIAIDPTFITLRGIVVSWCDNRPLPAQDHRRCYRNPFPVAAIYQALPQILGFDSGQLTLGLQTNTIHLRGIGSVFMTPSGAASKSGKCFAAELRRLGVPVAIEPAKLATPEERAHFLVDRFRTNTER